MIELPITEDDIKLAREVAKSKRLISRKVGFTPKFQTNAIENEIIGLIGEIKFGQFIGLKPNLNDIGNLFGGDFKINGKTTLSSIALPRCM